MKHFLVAVLVFLAVGCTHVSYTTPDGRMITYTSMKEFKSLELEIMKDDEEIMGHVRVEGVTADIAGEVADAVVKSMGITSGMEALGAVGKRIVQKKIEER